MRPTHSAVLDSHHSRSRLAMRRGFRHGRKNERRDGVAIAHRSGVASARGSTFGSANGSAVATPRSARPSLQSVRSRPHAAHERHVREEPGHEEQAHERRVRAARRTPGAPRTSEAITRGILVVVRVAMGLLLLTAGLGGVLGMARARGTHVQQDVMVFGGALMLTGSLLPLLKGTEVIIETVLDLLRALGARRADET